MPSPDSTSTATCATGSELFVRRVAGVVTLGSLALGYFVHDGFFLLTAFAGANLLQSSFTGICPPEWLYNWMQRREREAA